MKAKLNKLFTLLTILTLGITNVWADTYADVYTNPASGSGLAGNANGKGAFSAITCGTGTSFGNSALQIGTNGGSGSFTVASIDGSYITSIAFTSQSSYPINTLTSEQGTITIDGSVYTFTPNSATLTSATFSMSAKSGKKVRVAPITVNLTSDHSYLSMNFGVSSGTVSCTKSTGATDLVVTTTGSASSNRLSFGSGKTLTFTSEEHNISSINFTFVNHAAGSGITASTGTFAGSSWTPDEDVKTVTFSSSSSNTIGAISVKLAAAAPIPNYTVTIDPNGGSYASTPDGWTESAGVYTKSIASGTSFSAPAGLTNGTNDLSWKDGSDNDVTFPVSIIGDITFVAQWAPHEASSDATLSALSVAGCTLNETFDPATTAYTITLPFYGAMPVVGDVTATKNDPNAEDPEVSISGNVITIHCEAEDGTAEKDYTITVTISPAPTASSSINIEQLILDNSKAYNIGAALDAAHIGYVDKDALDSLTTAADRNEPYLGLKFKKSTSTITIVVPDGQYLKVKFGARKTTVKVSVNGATATDAAITDDVYTLAAATGVRQVVFSVTENNKTIVLKQVKINEEISSVTLPWLVTYDAGEHGTCATAEETWKGSALTLPVVTPESGWNFEGWKDDEDNPVTSPYTPTKNVTLTAQYTAQASPFDLTSLTYKIGTGAATNVGYVDGTFTYNIVLPYAPSYDAITVAPTLKEASSSLKGDEVLTVSSLPGAATFTVVEDGGADERLYTVNFTKAQKDGLSIIKAVATATGNLDITGENLTGALKGAAHSYTSGSYKFDTKRYFMLQLKDGENFQEGDVVEINVSSVNDCNGFTIYSNISGDDFADGDLIVDTHDETGAAAKISEGINKITLPSYAGSNKLYVARKSGTQKYLNAGINQVEVKRVMNPVMTAIQFNSTDVEVTSTTVAATLPDGTNLASMTVTPTIYWNGAGTAAVTGSWAWGSNTFVVTDKDGDATTYTITLTEDAPAVDPTLTYDNGAYNVGATALDLSTLITASNSTGAITYSVKTDGGTGAAIDGNNFTATAAGTATITASQAAVSGFNAKTVDFDVVVAVATEKDGVKLVEADALTGNFRVAAAQFKSGGYTIDGITYANHFEMSSNVSSDAFAPDAAATKHINYTMTKKAAKFWLYTYNTYTSAYKVYAFVKEEGEDVATHSVSVENGAHLVSIDVSVNKNAEVFFATENKSKMVICQIVAVESGDALLQGGEQDYVIDLANGRLNASSATLRTIDGIEYMLSGDYKVAGTSYAKIATFGTHYVKFTLASPLEVNITTANTAAYYVGTTLDTEDDNSKLNETSPTKNVASNFSLAAGTYYISPKSSEVQISKLEFSAPKCAEPVIDAQPASQLDFVAGDMTASVTAHATDGGTLSYQWYKAADDSEVTGQTTETLTTTEEGTYYVIVTNKLADHSDNFVKSDEATLKYRKANDATLSSLVPSTGTLEPAFDPEVLEYNVTLSEGTVDVPTLTATAAMAAYGATADVTDATAFVNYEATSTVLVTAEDHSTQQTYTVHFYVEHTILALVDVTGDMTWDFSKDGLADQATVGTEVIMANVAGVVNDANFKSDNIKVTANKQAGTKLQASMIMFHTTVDGLIKVVFSNTGDKSSERYLVVNGKKTDSGTKTKTNITYYGFVPAGDVVLTVIEGDGNMLNFASVQFTAKAAADLARDEAHGDDWMAPGELGTVCIPNGAVATGGDLYTLEGKNSDGKIVFATVPNNKMTPGVPYLFQATSNAMKFYYTDEATVADPDNSGAMQGTFSDQNLTELDNVYYFAGHALWSCSDLTSLEVKAYRAWVDMSKVGSGANPAPGRRYIIMDVHGQNATTGMDELNALEAPVKMIIDGKMYILRGEKLYDATGRMVK